MVMPSNPLHAGVDHTAFCAFSEPNICANFSLVNWCANCMRQMKIFPKAVRQKRSTLNIPTKIAIQKLLFKRQL